MDESASASHETGAGPLLDAVEARILGCLVEKAAITPEAYPLTVNALVLACNQKTGREPVMNLETGEVAHALRALEGRGLVKVAPSSQRALRYEHRFEALCEVTPRQRAILCVMMLRGPQTIAELFARGDRLADFPSQDDVRDTLERLLQREPAIVVSLPRAHGQREVRYMHLLCGPVEMAAMDAAEPSHHSRSGLADRIEQLETGLAQLREEVAALRRQIGDA